MNTVAKAEVDTIVETYNTPLAELNPAKVERFKADTLWPIFERLRREDPARPVHSLEDVLHGVLDIAHGFLRLAFSLLQRAPSPVASGCPPLRRPCAELCRRHP